MLKPLEQFICDTCHQPIETIEEGWVEWLNHQQEDGRWTTSNHRICHHNGRCEKLSYHENVSDNHLSYFLGNYTMPQLLGFLDIGVHFNRNYQAPTPENMRDFVVFVRRLTIPYFDEARHYLDRAVSESYGDSNEINLYLPKTLKAIIEEYQEY